MPCVEKFRETLDTFNVSEEIKKQIYEGFEAITSDFPKKKKALFFKRAVDIMEKELEPETVMEIFEANACCKTGARYRGSREFARINAGIPLEKRLIKIGKAPYMNMGSPYLNECGELVINAVSYVCDGKFACGCSNFRRLKFDYPVSKSYCYCCGGHFKYHYEIMLGVKLQQIEVVSSPLDSFGANPCVFRFAITGNSNE